MHLLRVLKIVILGLLFSTIFSSVYSQVNVNLRLINPSAQIFQVGDFNFTNSSQNTNYFFVDLANSSSQTFTVFLRLQICLDNQTIAEGTSNQFQLPGQSSYVFSSQQFATGTALIPETGEAIQIDFGGTVDLSIVQNLEDDVLTTGIIPTGTYAFKLAVIDVNTNTEFPDEQPEDHELVITNPTSIELLFPGNSISENQITEIATIFPFLQWYSDVNPAAASYNVRVYEKFPGDENVQDILSHPAIFHIEGLNQNFLQYPSSSSEAAFLPGTVMGPIRSLEPGKTYYWQVESVVSTISGQLVLDSDVFRFKVIDLNQVVNNAPQILAFLRQILGPDYEVVLQQLQEQGFEPDGILTLDGRSIEVNELIELLSQVIQSQMTIEGVETFDLTN